MTRNALTWGQLTELARKKRGWSADELREHVQSRNVSSANVTNWVKGGRPIPPRRYDLFAELLGCSVDELMGRTGKSVLVAGERDEAAMLLAAEITKLNPDMRTFVSTMIEVLVAKQRREERERLKNKRRTRDDELNA